MHFLLATLLEVCEMPLLGVMKTLFARARSWLEPKANRGPSLFIQVSQPYAKSSSQYSLPDLPPLHSVRSLAYYRYNHLFVIEYFLYGTTQCCLEGAFVALVTD